MSDSLKYTCIFGGGAVRGISYVGVIKAIRELGIEIDSIAGSSVGAVFAALYSLDFTTEELKDIFLAFNFNMFKDISFQLGSDFAFSKGEVFLNWLRELIEMKYYGESYVKGENAPVNFSDIEKDLYILTSDLSNNVPFVFSKNNTPDFEVAMAVRISASLPGLMKPTEYDNKFLVDGDLVKSWPLWRTDDGLCVKGSRVLEFRLEGCRECVSIKNPLDYLNSVFSTFSNFCTENVLSLYKHKDKFDYILIDTKDVLLIDFTLPVDKRLELIETGYNTTMKYFSETLIDKKQKNLPYYQYIRDSLSEVKEKLKNDKFIKAKNVLFELMANLYEPLEYIDTCFYKEINEFKQMFVPKVKAGLFSDSMNSADKTNCIKKLISIIEKLDEKCEEHIEYIKSYEKQLAQQ